MTLNSHYAAMVNYRKNVIRLAYSMNAKNLFDALFRRLYESYNYARARLMPHLCATLITITIINIVELFKTMNHLFAISLLQNRIGSAKVYTATLNKFRACRGLTYV